MKDFIFRHYLKFGTYFYERIFHEKMSDEVKHFFKSLSYVGAGTIIAALFSFTFNILAGRFLGPEGYGEFSLIQSVAMFLYIPMLLGFNTALIKYSAENEDFTRQSSIISTSYILVVIFTVISIIIYYIFSFQLSEIFSTSGEIFNLSVIFAVLFVFYTLTTSTLRGLHNMKRYAIFQPVYSAILLAVFLIFIANNFISSKSMVFSIYLAYGMTGGIILGFIRKHIRFELDRFWARKLITYGAYATISGVSSVLLTNIGRLFINSYLGIDQVGIYQAYAFATTSILSLLITPFITVFFSISSKSDKKAVWAKMKNGLFLLPMLIPFIFIFACVLIRYGYHYPISYELLLLFSLMSVIYIPGVSILGWFLSSFGKNGAKLESYSLIITAPIFVLLLYELVPRYGLIGSVLPVIITSILIMLLNIISIRRLLYEL